MGFYLRGWGGWGGGVLMALGRGVEIIYFLLGGSGLETYYRLNFLKKSIAFQVIVN